MNELSELEIIRAIDHQKHLVREDWERKSMSSKQRHVLKDHVPTKYMEMLDRGGAFILIDLLKSNSAEARAAMVKLRGLHNPLPWWDYCTHVIRYEEEI
jgi:hypothetical protein